MTPRMLLSLISATLHHLSSHLCPFFRRKGSGIFKTRKPFRGTARTKIKASLAAEKLFEDGAKINVIPFVAQKMKIFLNQKADFIKPWTGLLPFLSFSWHSSLIKYSWVDYSGQTIHYETGLAHVNSLSVGVFYIYIGLTCFHCQSIMLEFPLAEGSCVILFLTESQELSLLHFGNQLFKSKQL